jgi:uncharacterized membrane protein
MRVVAGIRRELPAIVAWAAVAAVALDLPMPVRAVLVVASSAWVSGAALAWLLESTDRLERAVLTVALSLSIATIVTVVLSMLHVMTGLRALAVIAVLSTVAVTLREMRGSAVDT